MVAVPSFRAVISTVLPLTAGVGSDVPSFSCADSVPGTAAMAIVSSLLLQIIGVVISFGSTAAVTRNLASGAGAGCSVTLSASKVNTPTLSLIGDVSSASAKGAADGSAA